MTSISYFRKTFFITQGRIWQFLKKSVRPFCQAKKLCKAKNFVICQKNYKHDFSEYIFTA